MKSCKIYALAITLLLVLQFLASCRKDINPIKPPPPVTVTSINPTSGGYGDTVTITGTHFSTNPAKDTVNFNNKRATVLRATADTLIVTVPLNAGTGAVTVNGATSEAAVFTYIPKIFVSTFAGGGMPNIPGGYVGGGYMDGPDTDARFNNPIDIAIDGQNNMYVADEANNLIRKISAGMASTFAGNAIPGLVNGPASQAEFNSPVGIVIDANNNIYVSDLFNNVIRKISAGAVSTYAGNGTNGVINGPAATAEFSFPGFLVLDIQNNLYVTEGSQIRAITPTSNVSTFAGNDSISGYANGPGTTARFNNTIGIAVDGHGNFYVADNLNYRIRKISPAGVVSTIAGSGTMGFQDGPADSAQFFRPSGIAIDAQDNVYVSDFCCIRKISPAGMVSTIAGTHIRGLMDGPAATAQVYSTDGMAFDSAGNLYVADALNQRIRKITFE